MSRRRARRSTHRIVGRFHTSGIAFKTAAAWRAKGYRAAASSTSDGWTVRLRGKRKR